MNANAVKKWLDEIQKDRNWLAEKLGMPRRTLDNWFSENRFVGPAEKLIERLQRESTIESARFTADEFEVLLEAKTKSGSPSIHDFIITAAMEGAKKLLNK